MTIASVSKKTPKPKYKTPKNQKLSAKAKKQQRSDDGKFS